MLAMLLVIVLLPALLALAAAWDVASFTIPNFIPAALIGGFLVFVALAHLPLSAVGWHALAAAIGLAAGFALFAGGLIGGGDAKFFAAALAWLGLANVLEYVLVASLFGGALALLMLGFRRLPLPESLSRQSWLARLQGHGGIPYGVALALAAIVILPHTDVFRAAAAL